MEILTSKAGVIALKFVGHLAREDVSKSCDLIEQALAANDKTHLFVEVEGLSGIDTETLTQDLARGLRMLGKLERFGRVAIVSDQAWLRWLARVESAVLPGVSYRTYTPAERERALAWAEGRAELPYGEALRLIETDRPEVLGIEVDGRLSKEEIASFSRELNAARGSRRITAVLVRIRSIEGLDPGIAFDGEYLRMKLGFLRELDHYAVVGGPRWIEQWIEFLRPLVRLEMRHFAADAEASAWEWLGATPAAAPARAA